jgi:uncharacterized protein YbdZ (MbtH family)
MNTQDENQDTVQNSAYNPFPQPQTVPAGWDTSVFHAAQQDDVDDVPSDAQDD